MGLIDLVNSVIICIISIDLTQMVNFPKCIPDCDSHSLALLDLFLFSDASICSTMSFRPLRISDHGLVLFPLISHQIHNRTPRFIALAYGCSRADWKGLHDHLRDVPWEDT